MEQARRGGGVVSILPTDTQLLNWIEQQEGLVNWIGAGLLGPSGERWHVNIESRHYYGWTMRTAIHNAMNSEEALALLRPDVRRALGDQG